MSITVLNLKIKGTEELILIWSIHVICYTKAPIEKHMYHEKHVLLKYPAQRTHNFITLPVVCADASVKTILFIFKFAYCIFDNDI